MIADLNRKMCEFAMSRLDAMGERQSGLSNYYAHLARRGSMLRPEEIAVAEYIASTVPLGASILELCAGAAQLGHLLSLSGYQVSAAEIDPLRCAFAVALGAHVGSACTVMPGAWQRLRLSNWKLIVTINAVTSHIRRDDTECLMEYARAGGEFIIRPRQFGAGIAVEIPGLQATEVFEDVHHYRRA